MSVTKRTRFEVLRRDGFRCYYCGSRGNETGEGLQIDHVVPVALGGTDEPSNLVAACRDCNYGKSSVHADAQTVADVDRVAAEFNRARAIAVAALEADYEAEAEYISDVWETWDNITPNYAKYEPRDMESFAADWYRRGVPLIVVEKALRISWDGPASRAEKARYAGGVIKNLMAGAEDRTRALVAGDDVVWNKAWRKGFIEGQLLGAEAFDVLAPHIDAQKCESAVYSAMSVPYPSRKGTNAS